MSKTLLNRKRKASKNLKEDVFEKENWLFNKAKTVFERQSYKYSLYNKDNSKDNRWTLNLIKSGGFDDKLSALSIFLQKHSVARIDTIDTLFRMCKTSNRKQAEAVLSAIKDLFVNYILNDTPSKTFLKAIEGNANSDESTLAVYYADDLVGRKYTEFIRIIEEKLRVENIPAIKRHCLTLLLEMIIKKPQCEDLILTILINKLGDPKSEVSNVALRCLMQLQMVFL